MPLVGRTGDILKDLELLSVPATIVLLYVSLTKISLFANEDK